MCQIKTFGMLIKGLRVGINLLSVLQREDHGILALSKSVDIPTLSSLDELVHQFEEAIDNDFPRYQVLGISMCISHISPYFFSCYWLSVLDFHSTLPPIV
jgi:hypothetical protein